MHPRNIKLVWDPVGLRFRGRGLLAVALLSALTPLCLVSSLPLPKYSPDSVVVTGALSLITGPSLSSAPGHRGLGAQLPWRLHGGALPQPLPQDHTSPVLP